MELQLLLWTLIDMRKETAAKLDYLQIFELFVEPEKDVQIQKIVHEQERPKAKDIYYVLAGTPINTKIWVIDSGDYSTMLFPHEY